MKAIVRVRVSAVDVEEVKEWFHGFRTYYKKYNIEARDVLNFNEAGFCVRVPPIEEIVVPTYVKEVSI